MLVILLGASWRRFAQLGGRPYGRKFWWNAGVLASIVTGVGAAERLTWP
jgi:hypothetical protein